MMRMVFSGAESARTASSSSKGARSLRPGIITAVVRRSSTFGAGPTRTTENPACAASRALAMPTGPVPTTRMSAVLSLKVLSFMALPPMVCLYPLADKSPADVLARRRAAVNRHRPAIFPFGGEWR